MNIWVLLIVIFVGGAIGGAANALISDNGFIMPLRQQEGNVINYRPGFLGNLLTGGIAATISWGLYGPLSGYFLVVVGKSSTPAETHTGVTIAAFVGAILIGVGGARWLTNEVDKNILRDTASQAAAGPESPALAAKIQTSTPSNALKAAVNNRSIPN
jgi:hypothetical protein